MAHRFHLRLLPAFTLLVVSCTPSASFKPAPTTSFDTMPPAVTSTPPTAATTTMPPDLVGIATTTSTTPPPVPMVETIGSDGITEDRILARYVPAVIDDLPRPLIVVLHEYGGGAQTSIQDVGLREAAAGGGWVMLAPSGMVDTAGNRYWNATAACCDRDHRRNDDIGYLRQIIIDALIQYPIDRGRVVVVGGSNGGFMAYQLACDVSDLVTAVVVIAGTEENTERACQPSLPVSVFHVHGTEDRGVKFEGGELSVLLERIAPYPAATETVRRWARRNNCPTEEPTKSANVEADQGSWVNCALGTSIHYAWVEQGHNTEIPASVSTDIIDFIGRQVRAEPQPIAVRM